MSNDITQLSIEELLTGDAEYIIPTYQRNYAWEEGEITQLLQDVIDYLPDGKHYYIGTLVVYERTTKIYEVIDGQQRLTTLSLLAAYLNNTGKAGNFSWFKTLPIRFESRRNSQATFAKIFEGNIGPLLSGDQKDEETNTAILNGYQLIQRILPQKLKEHKHTDQEFADYLLKNVQIMRVKVPNDTDLNHYFEIMNSRGEQLEKHEILKARMMAVLNKIENPSEKEQSLYCLNTVWEACANMEKYVQLGFTAEQRNAIFGEKNWDDFTIGDFGQLREKLKASKQGSTETANGVSAKKPLLQDIISQAQNGIKLTNTPNTEDDSASERFNSVINFPNFLLHVLRVTQKQDIPLDDKKLIENFDKFVLKADKPDVAVKAFIFALLRCKYLYDKYVIKREFIKEKHGWSLKRFKWNDGGGNKSQGRGSYVNTFGREDEESGKNRQILMLLSVFHVSNPTQVYKHWLNGALFYLFYAETIAEDAYLNHLESLAKAFVFDRFLAPSSNVGASYFTMIYTHNGQCKNKRDDFSDEHLAEKLSFENIENNLIFNYLDYLLWLKHKGYSSYEFTFRSSVEHYYPQTPKTDTPMQAEKLHSFGNLCLISHSKNSSLSNYMPTAKKEHYGKIGFDSIKQRLMMDEPNWDETSVDKHYQAMKEILLDCKTACKTFQGPGEKSVEKFPPQVV